MSPIIHDRAYSQTILDRRFCHSIGWISFSTRLSLPPA
jgi:hypothetical protein